MPLSARQYVEALVTASPHGVFEVSAEGICTAVNPAWATLTRAAKPPIGSPWVEAFHPDERARAAADWARAAAAGRPYRAELRLLRGDGTSGHVIVVCVAVHDEERIAGYVGTATDVSAEAELLDQVFTHTLDRMAVLDRDFNFVRVTEAYARAGQRKPTDYPGVNHFELYPSDFEAEAREVRRTRTVYQRSARPFVYADHPEWGTTYWDVGFVPILDGRGDPERFLLTLLDVTQRVRAQDALKEALAERDTLLREIHHRVKNNLQIVSGFLRFQARKVPDGPGREAFVEMHERLLAMSLVHEKMYQAHDLSRVALPDYLSALVSALASSLGTTGRVDTRVDVADVSLPIEAALPVGMIVTELTTNTYKYAFPSGGTGTLSLTVRESGERLVLQMDDDGVGFPADFAPDGDRSFGWQLVRALVVQLDGDVQHRNAGGAHVLISFPRSA